MEINLDTFDFIVIAVYFIGIIVYGISQSKRASSEEYFLGGRSLTWPVVGISLFAANISSSTLIGLAGSAYVLDMTVYNYEWYAVLVLVFFAIFFLPFYLKSGVYTMPEFLERRYDSLSRYYFSFVTVVGNVLIDTAASLYVGTLVLGLIFPELPPWVVIVFLAAAAAAYTIPGGLNSVVKTEVIQAIVLILGSIVLTYYGLSRVGGWSGMTAKLDEMKQESIINKNADESLSIVRSEEINWDQVVQQLDALQTKGILDRDNAPTIQIVKENKGDIKAINKAIDAQIKTINTKQNEALKPLEEKLSAESNKEGPKALQLSESIKAIKEKANADKENIAEVRRVIKQYNEPIVPWWGLLTGVPLLGFYFWANNQFMVQRVLSSKNLNHGRWGALFAGLLKLPVILIMVIPGTLAFLIFQDESIAYQTTSGACTNLADCPDYTYPSLLFELLPTGLLGLVVAGLLAAMMSSISATFNSASTLITMDFVNKIRPNMTSKQLVRSGQISTLILVILASLWAPQIGKYGDLFKYLQDILGYIAPPIVSAFILGLFWKRANSAGSIVSLIFGMIMAVVWVAGIIGEVDHWFFQMHFLMRTTVLFLLCLVVHIIVSLSTPAPTADKLKGMVWTPKLIKEETEELAGLPWYLNYRYLSIILLIITAFVVGYFW